MKAQSLVRDAALLFFAGALGWWAHGGNAVVHANGTSSDSARGADNNLAFQFGGAGIEGGLTIYNRDNHTLYVYPSAINNNHINCAFSIHVEKPGAPLERSNCPIGGVFTH
ncbi:MAG TPA: hypothetical protein VGN16_08170 [Acidobacteriaceae bacterium]